MTETMDLEQRAQATNTPAFAVWASDLHERTASAQPQPKPQPQPLASRSTSGSSSTLPCRATDTHADHTADSSTSSLGNCTNNQSHNNTVIGSRNTSHRSSKTNSSYVALFNLGRGSATMSTLGVRQAAVGVRWAEIRLEWEGKTCHVRDVWRSVKHDVWSQSHINI